MADVDVGDVRVLDADVAAIGCAQREEDVAELHLTAPEVGADIEGRSKVFVGECEVGEGELGVRGGRGGEWIEMSLEVADGAVGIDEMVDARLLETVDNGDGGRGGSIAGSEGGGRGGPVAAEGEALEEGAPRRIDGVGVLEPGFIGRLDNGGVGVSGKGGCGGYAGHGEGRG